MQIPRIFALIEKYGDRFITRILGPAEIEKYNSLSREGFIRSGFLAKRFAAKEAVSKAIGEGIGRSLRFTDILILNDDYGRPFVEFKREIDSIKVHLSLADDYPTAIAFATAEKIN